MYSTQFLYNFGNTFLLRFSHSCLLSVRNYFKLNRKQTKKNPGKKNNLSLKITETSFIKPILKADFIIVISWTFT